MSEICHVSYIFFFLFFSNTSVIFLFLADTGLFPFVGFLLSPVKPDFFELGPDISSSWFLSPDSFLIFLGCFLFTKTQEITH